MPDSEEVTKSPKPSESGSYRADVEQIETPIIGSVIGNSSTITYHYSDALDRLSKAESGNVQEIAASQIQLLKSFYDLALAQAGRSFKWALVSAGIGLAFFMAAVAFLLFEKSLSVATISVISGALVEVIAGVNFYLYNRTISQLGMFHLRLDFTQRLLLANSLCEGLNGENKEKARSGLIASLAIAAEGQWKEAHNTVGRANG